MNLHLWSEYGIVYITETFKIEWFISDSISAAYNKQTALYISMILETIFILEGNKKRWSEKENGHHDKTELQVSGKKKQRRLQY